MRHAGDCKAVVLQVAYPRRDIHTDVAGSIGESTRPKHRRAGELAFDACFRGLAVLLACAPFPTLLAALAMLPAPPAAAAVCLSRCCQAVAFPVAHTRRP